MSYLRDDRKQPTKGPSLEEAEKARHVYRSAGISSDFEQINLPVPHGHNPFAQIFM